jgi:hypothetical protein
MERLSPIDEDNKDPSGRSEPYEDLPLVTPKARTLDEVTQRQNAENAKLRKQLLAYQNKEAQLTDRVQELEELTAALVNPTGRNPIDKTANNTNDTRTSASAFTPTSCHPVQPSRLNSAGPSTPRRCVPSCPEETTGRTNRSGRKINSRAQYRDRGSEVVFQTCPSTYRKQQY